MAYTLRLCAKGLPPRGGGGLANITYTGIGNNLYKPYTGTGNNLANILRLEERRFGEKKASKNKSAL